MSYSSTVRIAPIASAWRTLRLVLATFCLFLTANDALAQAGPGQEFTIVALPDPQIMTRDYPQIFAAQTKWIADNAQARNIRFVAALGDMVHDAESEVQWQNADMAMRNLDGKVPYGVSLGNHDYDNEAPSSRSAVHFNQYFGKSRYALYPWYKGSYSSTANENFWAEFTANGQAYVVLVLEFHPRDTVLEWARAVLAANPGKPVILITHSYTYSDDTRIDRCDTSDMDASQGNNGEVTWEKFVRSSNAVMVLSGHITSGGPGRRTDVAEGGHLVHQMLANYQDWPSGGGGYMRLIRFIPAQGRIEVKTYSPWDNTYLSDAENDFSLAMNADPSLQTGKVSGRVRSAQCAAVAGATVTAAGLSATTDSGGYFSFPAPIGTQTVTVSKAGWQTASSTDVVRPGYGVHLDFYLAAACPTPGANLTVSICAPANGAAVASPVRVTATAASAAGVKLMQVYVDGLKKYENSGSVMDTSLSMAAGARRLTVQAKDNAGNIFKSTVYVTVSSSSDGCALNPVDPSVTICQPVDGASVRSPVRVVARPTSSSPVKFMQVYLDGVRVFHVDAGDLDTAVSMTPGAHRLTVQAKNSEGVIFKKTIYITVSP